MPFTTGDASIPNMIATACPGRMLHRVAMKTEGDAEVDSNKGVSNQTVKIVERILNIIVGRTMKGAFLTIREVALKTSSALIVKACPQIGQNFWVRVVFALQFGQKSSSR